MRNLIAKRYVIAILLCFGFFISRGMVFHILSAWNLSVMFNRNEAFNWKYNQIDEVFQANTYAFLSSIIIGGLLSCKYPSSQLIGISIGGCSVLHLLMPLSISAGHTTVIIVTVLKGLLEGLAVPLMHGLWRFWAPSNEKILLVMIALFGFYMDIFINIELSYLILGYIGYWAVCFYFYGALGILWTILWFWLVYEKPSLHPTITETELFYLEKSIDTQTISPIQLKKIPFKEMLTSLPFYALLIASFCSGWNIYILLIFTQFLYSQGIESEERNFFYYLRLILAIALLVYAIIAYVASRLPVKKPSETTQKKLTVGVGLLAMAPLLPFVGIYFTSSANAKFVALIAAVLFQGGTLTGVYSNQLDLAPRYAGLLIGFSFWFEQVAFYIVSHVVAKLNEHTLEKENWLSLGVILFSTAIALNIFGGVFYLVCGSGEKQNWANDSTTRNNVESDLELSNNAKMHSVHLSN